MSEGFKFLPLFTSAFMILALPMPVSTRQSTQNQTAVSQPTQITRGRTACRMCLRRRPPTILSITKPDLRRLSRRGGVKRTSHGIYDSARRAMKKYLECVIRDAVLYMDNEYRSTLTSPDVVNSLRQNGPVPYRFGA
ncbi:hypothetical protein DFH09DRAFT_1146128 [Mycena vulgaris]|nr:hypothetical protein DFH09DRAFT_1146128 [Mycena vulgaris]